MYQAMLQQTQCVYQHFICPIQVNLEMVPKRKVTKYCVKVTHSVFGIFSFTVHNIDS